MELETIEIARVRQRLHKLYGSRSEELIGRVLRLVDESKADIDRQTAAWDERDCVLITYADQVRAPRHAPLATLREFLLDVGLDQLINTVHLLPMYPYSSDDGFSVIDFRAVDPGVGDWDDVARLGRDFSLMFDLVLNHVSSRSQWFQDYQAGKSPYDRFFIECDRDTDLSQVVRPRSLPLLTTAKTKNGSRCVWTTFSEDQIDLNYAEPAVLLEMLDILLEYARRGARIIRLDAIAYLWKKIGTSCIHLDETHEVVKLMRDVLQMAAPHVLILTETNVPHEQNVSYFGDGDEAHMVYQFSLPPLLLDAFVSADATAITNWLSGLDDLAPDTTYFNFTASHDGVGVRPLEGLVSPRRMSALVEHVRRNSGRVSTRRNSDGSDSPYELNISYVDALKLHNSEDVATHARRFLASQAVMLALRGIPGIYFHSLVGSPNDLVGLRESEQPRRINRKKYQLDELQHAIQNDPLQRRVFDGYRGLLEIRRTQPAFHPDARQEVVTVENPQLMVFRRYGLDDRESILVATNFSSSVQQLDVSGIGEGTRDLISGSTVVEGCMSIDPWTTVWLQE